MPWPDFSMRQRETQKVPRILGYHIFIGFGRLFSLNSQARTQKGQQRMLS